MDVQSLIAVYRAGFYASAVVAVVGAALAVALFFRFDIRNLWLIQTGRAQRQGVRQMEAASRNEGRMRREENRRGVLPSEDLAGEPASRTDELARAGQAPPTTKLEPPDAPAPEPPQDGPPTPEVQNGFGSTMDLGGGPSPVVGQRAAETTVLGAEALRFEITEEVLLIHTDEVI